MKVSAKEIPLVALFTALTALGAFITIPIGEVPITLQSLFVLLSGLILGPKLGALSQILYIVLGLIGVPIFANLSGGFQYIVKPSFGFLMGFIFAAYVTGKIAHSEGEVSAIKIWIGSLMGTLVIYLFGIPYMYYILNLIMAKNLSFTAVLNMGCILFLPGDTLKWIFTSLIATKIIPLLKRVGLSIN
ncbi:MAG: biotin transporter BioY [Tissierellia bacterium]|nr:biotin transporter BioY [Tissierellia bacterium]